MSISDFFKIGINPATAYILGLCYPLLKEKQIDKDYFILGSVNHNANMITEPEIATHFIKVSELINRHIHTDMDMLLVYNNSPIYGSLQSKKGFSVVMKKDMEYHAAMRKMAEELKTSSEECRVQFARGCFDGRSSFDTSRHFLAIDVDRDHKKQELIASIIESLGVRLDINQREIDYPKNDQIRIVPNRLNLFMQKIGFYSVRRENIINDYLSTTTL